MPAAGEAVHEAAGLAAFLEMAETWDMIFKQEQERSRLQASALADRCRKVLFLSDIAPQKPAEADNNEKAA